MLDARAIVDAPATGVREETISYELVFVNYQSSQRIEELLASLPANTPFVIVDNAANTDPADALADRYRSGRYFDAGGNLGFAAAANLGGFSSSADVLLFLNPDCATSIDVLEELIRQVQFDTSCGASAPALLDGSGAPQLGVGGWQPTVMRCLVHAVGGHRVFSRRGLWAWPRRGQRIDLEWLAGTCLAVDRQDFIRVGGFDERHFLYNEDMALGRRLREAGRRQVLRADLSVTHGGGTSTEVPRPWVWAIRATAMRDYLGFHNGAGRAAMMRASLAAGYLLRAVCYALLQRPAKKAEMLAYAGKLLSLRPDTSTVEKLTSLDVPTHAKVT